MGRIERNNEILYFGVKYLEGLKKKLEKKRSKKEKDVKEEVTEPQWKETLLEIFVLPIHRVRLVTFEFID